MMIVIPAVSFDDLNKRERSLIEKMDYQVGMSESRIVSLADAIESERGIKHRILMIETAVKNLCAKSGVQYGMTDEFKALYQNYIQEWIRQGGKGGTLRYVMKDLRQAANGQ